MKQKNLQIIWKTLVIKGNLQEREQLIQNINDYDLVITSYDLLKRDIGLYKDYHLGL